MRSLFFKIFTSFILIMVLAITSTVFISHWVQIGPFAELKKRVEGEQKQALSHTLAVTGLGVKNILAGGEKADLFRYLHDVEQLDHLQVFLFIDGQFIGAQKHIPAMIRALMSATQRSQRMQHHQTADELMVALPVVAEEGQGLVLVGVAKRAEHSLSAQGVAHHPPGLPIPIMVGLAAIGCFFLARSLTAPIRKLRQATRKIATGDFSARVDNIGAGGDEIADLSRDFNVMVKQTEVLLESQKRLLRDISHELRSPLTRQNVALELALQKFPEAESYLQRIAKESARLDELVDHLLVLTRLEGGGAGVVQEEISVRQVLLSIVQDAAFEASSLNRTINLQNGDDVVVVGSAEMLGRAFENVIRNGVRYTPENSVVDVALIQKENEVVVTVRDHGPGVSEEYLEHIFTPFFRVATSRTRDSGGVGVGLAIAKQAVLLHGGRIVARNAADGGLVVEMAVPLATA